MLFKKHILEFCFRYQKKHFRYVAETILSWSKYAVKPNLYYQTRKPIVSGLNCFLREYPFNRLSSWEDSQRFLLSSENYSWKLLRILSGRTYSFLQDFDTTQRISLLYNVWDSYIECLFLTKEHYPLWWNHVYYETPKELEAVVPKKVLNRIYRIRFREMIICPIVDKIVKNHILK